MLTAPSMTLRSMARLLLSLLLATLAAGVFAAPRPGWLPTRPILTEDKIPFDYTKAEIKQIDGRWKVVVGNLWLLDFAGNKAAARKALETILYYHMNEQCFVGRPNAPMQYYLVNGKAPDIPMPGEDSITFKTDKLAVKLVGGNWKVVDGNHYLLDFGAKEIEARKALAIIKKYGFNTICFVGRPHPPMMYFRKGPAKYQEDIVTFNYATAEVKLINGRWKVMDGNHMLLDFAGKEAEARKALNVIKTYRLNQHGFVGRPNPPFEYYLSDGKAPVGPIAGEDAIPFIPENTEVTKLNGSWYIIDSGNHSMLYFGTKELQARQAMALIRLYDFTIICFVGRPDAPMVYFRK
ncbi:MAG: hypothetical protein ACYC7E_00475 [Armatimonadota bacterium]